MVVHLRRIGFVVVQNQAVLADQRETHRAFELPGQHRGGILRGNALQDAGSPLGRGNQIAFSVTFVHEEEDAGPGNGKRQHDGQRERKDIPENAPRKAMHAVDPRVQTTPPPLFLLFDAVAYPTNGLNARIRPLAGCGQLLTKCLNVNVDRARFTCERRVPYFLQKHTARKDPVRMAHQGTKQIELLQGKRNGLAAGSDRVRGGAKLDWAHCIIVVGGRCRSLGATQQGIHAAYQLHHAEWLGQIVVCSSIKTRHLVELGAFGGKHHDRNMLHRWVVTNDAKDLKPIDARQHDVKKHKLGHASLASSKKLGSVGESNSFEPCLLQCVNRKIANVPIVFNVIDHLPNPFP